MPRGQNSTDEFGTSDVVFAMVLGRMMRCVSLIACAWCVLTPPINAARDGELENAYRSVDDTLRVMRRMIDELSRSRMVAPQGASHGALVSALSHASRTEAEFNRLISEARSTVANSFHRHRINIEESLKDASRKASVKAAEKAEKRTPQTTGFGSVPKREL